MLSLELRNQIIEGLLSSFDCKKDGMNKNIVFSHCPFCNHAGYKYGVYIGQETRNKTFGSSNCFHCQRKFRTLEDTLIALNMQDLLPKETTELNDELETKLDFPDDDVIDDSLKTIEMPKGYKRCFKNIYLKSRGFTADDYEYFPCGTTRGINFKFNNYVLLEIRDSGKLVGYVGRHIWSKSDIDNYNLRHRFQIRRYNNSTDNGFSKLLYNIDSVNESVDTVILCEGCFDVIALTRKLELYDSNTIVPVATFGKKISDVQIYKLQSKGVKTIVMGYDADAKESISKTAIILDKYFDVYVADLSNSDGKDWDEMSEWNIYDVFEKGLKTVREFNLE